MRRTIAALTLVALAACARDEAPDLLTLQQAGDGPDEFLIVPTRPLQTPADYATLPPPAPGAANLVDPQPRAEAALALGGRPEVLARVSGDGALTAYAGRRGVDPSIRGTLAAEDLALRKRNPGRLLERLFGVNRYYRVYDPEALDPYRELDRFRAAGVPTPAAPPPAE